MLNKYLLTQIFLPVTFGLFSIFFLYNSAMQTVSIKFVFPIFIFFLFTLYFFSDQILTGFFFIFYLLVGFLSLLFSSGSDRLIVFLEIGYLVVIYIFAEKFWQTFLEKSAFLREANENLEVVKNDATKTQEELLKKEDGLKTQLDNYKSLTDIIQNVSSTFDTKAIENFIINLIKKFIPKGTGKIFFKKNNDPIINDVFDKNIIVEIDSVNYSQYRGAGIDFKSCVAVPLTNKGQTIAVVRITSDKEHCFNDADIRILSVLSDIFSLNYINAQLYKRTEELAIRDGLTGLFVHSYFMEILSENISTAEHSKVPLSLMMLDIDNFKFFNDTYGHEAGDEVLKFVADGLRVNTRETDIVARYGGEEFAVILPYTIINDARVIAERTRKWLETKEVNFQNNVLKITASFGVSEFTKSELSIEEFINSVDTNLYSAKKRGKNCVV